MSLNNNIPQIVSEIQNGDKDKFTILVNTYKESVFRIALGYMHSKADAEDIVQDVFIKAYQAIGSFKGNSEFSTWLFRITVNTCLNAISKKVRGSFIQRTEETISKLFNVRSHEKNPEETMVKSELDKAIRKAIESLPKQQKTAFTLRRYEDLYQSEISKIMEISEGAVEQLLQRAKANLNKKLDFLNKA